MEFVKFLEEEYPIYETEGNAAQFIAPFALKWCVGTGYDIGCSKLEWALPGAIPVDVSINDDYHANNLPYKDVDYIFSSHCLEHIDDWVTTLIYWNTVLRQGGVMFLYLPHFSQKYWRPWNNRKHIHALDADIISSMIKDCLGYEKVFTTGIDLNHSFAVVGIKS